MLHDLGKLGIADAILHKPGALDESEWKEIVRHPEIGARILEHAGMRDIAGWVRAHHERVDGRGYPKGIGGEEIPLEARILAVADAYEAMIADRPYRAGMPAATACEELIRCAGHPVRPGRRRRLPGVARARRGGAGRRAGGAGSVERTPRQPEASAAASMWSPTAPLPDGEGSAFVLATTE